MLNQVLKKKREAKKTRQRKDYERRRNINGNVPSVRMVEQVKVFQTIPFPTGRGGKITSYARQVVQVGFKPVVRKVKKPRYHENGSPSYVYKKDEQGRHVPMIPYPPSKKKRVITEKLILKYVDKTPVQSSKVSKSPSNKRAPQKASIRSRAEEHKRSRLSRGEV